MYVFVSAANFRCESIDARLDVIVATCHARELRKLIQKQDDETQDADPDAVQNVNVLCRQVEGFQF